MSPRCQLSAKALRDLADLVEAGVVTLTTVNTTYSTVLDSDKLPLSTLVDLKFTHIGSDVPELTKRRAVIVCTGNLLSSVTQSNVEIRG